MVRMLIDEIVSICNKAIETTPRMMQGGCNGPWHDRETPVRNTSHWLVMLGRMFRITSHKGYKDCAEGLAEYLYSKEARPHGYSFHHRQGPRDRCNGLIGQAWTFEALAEATILLDDPKYLLLAREVFLLHPFDEQLGLWHIMEIDGSILPIDSTLNHQLWFAACAMGLSDGLDDEIAARVRVFLDQSEQNLTILPNGLIYHPIERLVQRAVGADSIASRMRRAAGRIKSGLGRCFHKILFNGKGSRIDDKRSKQVTRSIGYHAFNTYAFAMLQPHFVAHPFWQTERYKQTIVYLLSDEHQDALEGNPYGYPYNPPGFERPYSAFVLSELSREDLLDLTQQCVNDQFKRCYDPHVMKMNRNTEDPETATARIYEILRLPVDVLSQIKLDL